MTIQTLCTPVRRLTSTPAPAPRQEPSPTPEEPQDSFGSRVLGGVAGALIGAVAGHAGPEAVTAFAGLAGGAATGSVAVPYLAQAVKDGLNGDPLNDLSLVCSTTFAGGVLLSSSAAGAAALAYPLARALPAAAPIIGAIIGGAAGAFIGLKN